MKQVEVYKLDKSNVMVYDSQDIIEYRAVGDLTYIIDSDDDFVQPSELTYKEIRLPIRRYCTVGRRDIYAAFDDDVMKLLGIHEEDFEREVGKRNREINTLTKELDRIKGMTAWETAKVAFSKLWSKQ